MKKMFFWFNLLFITTVLLGCSKEKEEIVPTLQEKFVGSWRLLVYTYDEAGNQLGDALEINPCNYLEFLSNGSGLDITYKHANCEIAGNDTFREDKPFTWRVEGDMLYMKFPKEESENKAEEEEIENKAKIVSASNTEIVFDEIPRYIDWNFNPSVAKNRFLLRKIQ